jgi:hypothetical protein
MSHIVHIKTQVREASAVAAACQRLQLPPPVACRDASALLEAALGQASSERLTAEFYASQSEQLVLRERGLA